MRSVMITTKYRKGNFKRSKENLRTWACKHSITRIATTRSRSTISPSLELIHRHPHEAHGMAYAAKHKVTKALDPVI